MSIIRSPRKDRGFTVISNSVAQDSRLSMRALGLLVRLLSRPDNWETNSTTLAREFDVGREQMQGVLRELTSFGYMELVKHRQTDGTFISRWYIYDEPKTGEPERGEPAPENPYAGEPGCINKNLVNLEPIHPPHTPQGGRATGKSRSANVNIDRPEDIAEQVWNDWIALRKSKKAPVTETVLSQARKEAQKAQMTIEDFLCIWCARGSQGLQADWIKPAERQIAGQQRMSYAQQDDMARRARWEEMTGRKWPENGSTQNVVIDAETQALEIRYESAD